MPIDTALVRILVLLLPGLTGRVVYSRLKANRKTSLWEAVVEVFLFAFISYLLAGVVCMVVARPSADVAASSGQGVSYNIQAILSDSDNIDWLELYVAAGISIALAVGVAFAYNHKLVNRVGRAFRITQSFGDDDVWEYIHNSPDIEWIYLRDKLQGIVYYGRIRSYSDSQRPREMVLSEVIAYDAAGTRLYEVDGVYIARATDEMTIEIPLFTSHVPDSLTAKEYCEMETAASLDELVNLRKVYKYDEHSTLYRVRKCAPARRRRRLQGLLKSEGYSVIHIREGRDSNDQSTRRQRKEGRK